MTYSAIGKSCSKFHRTGDGPVMSTNMSLNGIVMYEMYNCIKLLLMF